MKNVTLEQLMIAMKAWNTTQVPGFHGAGTYDVGTLLAGLSVFEDADWKMISSGPLEGKRYCVCEHGFILQAPKPINEMSLIQFETGKLLGLVK